MIASKLDVLLNVYTQIAPGSLFRLLQRNLGITKRTGVYTARVVLWMMLAQRLHRRGSLADVVDQLTTGGFDGILSRCKRVREHHISDATGGYCQARQNLPTVLVERSVEEILQRLQNRFSQRGGEQPRVYVLDGSSLQLEASAELKRLYPPAPNQRGESHWPILRIVLLHDVETGLAQKPCWGPMYGSGAVSEQALATRAIDVLPPGAIVMGDRNFGVFGMAWAIHQRGHHPLIRLTADRAVRLVGGPITQPGEYAVQWRASRWDRLNREERLADAVLNGRLIAARVGRGKSQQWLFVFTTALLSGDDVVALYGQRWKIETDLRSLKQTARLQRVAVRSSDMLSKELLAAVLAYNLVRALMTEAARRAHVDPRQLSFTRAYNLVEIGIQRMLVAGSTEEQERTMTRIVDEIGRRLLPHRKHHRSYPRAVWGRGERYPCHTKTK
jgi:putative transposase